MLDCSVNAATVLQMDAVTRIQPQAIVAYTGTGGAGVYMATPSYVQSLFARGLRVLAVFNDPTVDSGHTGEAGGDADRAVVEFMRLNVPKGRAVGYDIERVADDVISGAYLVGVVVTILDAGWIPVLYVSGFDPQFSRVLDEALALDPTNMARCYFWLASWITEGELPAPPDWSNPRGPAGLPWQAVHIAQVVAWQWGNAGDFDLSIVHASLDNLLWAPSAPPAPEPTPTPTPTQDTTSSQAQIASLQQQLAAANATNARLRSVLQTLAAQAGAAVQS